jgi:hypothetical protein
MGRQEQIDAIRAGLAALDTAIGQTDSALRMASDPDDIRSLTSTLVDLRSERSRLQAQLDNLEAASIEVEALAAAGAVRSLQRGLRNSLTDRSVVAATLAFAKTVHGQAKELRTLGEARPEPKTAKARKKKKRASK